MRTDLKAPLPTQTLDAIDAMSADIRRAAIHAAFMRLYRQSLLEAGVVDPREN